MELNLSQLLLLLLHVRPPGDVASLLFLRHVRRGLVPDGAGVHPRAAGQREEPEGGEGCS